jgi:hypothetical protein
MLLCSDAVQLAPAALAGHEGMEQVPECQTPFFLAEVTAGVRRRVVRLPPEAPTTRAFACPDRGPEGATAEQVLGRPVRPYQRMASPRRSAVARAGRHRDPELAAAPGARPVGFTCNHLLSLVRTSHSQTSRRVGYLAVGLWSR